MLISPLTNRIVTLWNSLSEKVVSSGSVNLSENRLDTFLHGQDIVYNREAKRTSLEPEEEVKFYIMYILILYV